MLCTLITPWYYVKLDNGLETDTAYFSVYGLKLGRDVIFSYTYEDGIMRNKGHDFYYYFLYLEVGVLAGGLLYITGVLLLGIFTLFAGTRNRIAPIFLFLLSFLFVLTGVLVQIGVPIAFGVSWPHFVKETGTCHLWFNSNTEGPCRSLFGSNKADDEVQAVPLKWAPYISWYVSLATPIVSIVLFSISAIAAILLTIRLRYKKTTYITL